MSKNIKKQYLFSQLNKIVKEYIPTAFIVIWLVSFVVAVVEVVIYPGFIKNHFYINSYFVYTITAVLGLLFKISGGKRTNVYYQKLLKLNPIIILVSGLALIIFTLLETWRYPNFVFSIFHIHPNALIWPFLISLILFVVEEDFSYKTKKLAISNKKIFKQKHLVLALTIWVLFSHLKNIDILLRKRINFMLKYPRATYDEKMGEAIGEIYYKHVLFLKDYISENSKIMIPPKAYPWPQIGNAAYVRYFLYPREIVHGKEYEPALNYKEEDVDYVIISWGETVYTQNNYTHGWPKFDVPSDEIIYYGEDGEIVRKEEDYRYEDYKDKKIWGLIKVRK